MTILIEQIVQNTKVGNALIFRIPVGEVRLQCCLIHNQFLLRYIPDLKLNALVVEVSRVYGLVLHQADIVYAQIGAIAARSLAKAEARGAAIGIAVLQIVCALHALITIASNHILFAEATAIDLVAHFQLSAWLVAAASAAAWKLIEAMGTTVTGSAHDIIATLAGSIEHVALLITIRYAHVIAVALLAANHLMEAISVRRASIMRKIA